MPALNPPRSSVSRDCIGRRNHEADAHRMNAAWVGRWLLLVPAGLGVLASWRGPIPAKLGVPLSCVLILGAVCRPGFRERRDVWGLMAALVFSAAGDWFLSNRAGRETYFLAGIGLFFCAHLGYIGCALAHGRFHRVVLGALLVAYVPYYLLWLHPVMRSSVLALAVVMYTLVSCLALAAAAGMEAPRGLKAAYVGGIGLIVFSDTLISFSEFLQYHALRALILPTYYLAHLCVTWAALGFPKPGIESKSP